HHPEAPALMRHAALEIVDYAIRFESLIRPGRHEQPPALLDGRRKAVRILAYPVCDAVEDAGMQTILLCNPPECHGLVRNALQPDPDTRQTVRHRGWLSDMVTPQLADRKLRAVFSVRAHWSEGIPGIVGKLPLGQKAILVDRFGRRVRI